MVSALTMEPVRGAEGDGRATVQLAQMVGKATLTVCSEERQKGWEGGNGQYKGLSRITGSIRAQQGSGIAQCKGTEEQGGHKCMEPLRLPGGLGFYSERGEPSQDYVLRRHTLRLAFQMDPSGCSWGKRLRGRQARSQGLTQGDLSA